MWCGAFNPTTPLSLLRGCLEEVAFKSAGSDYSTGPGFGQNLRSQHQSQASEIAELREGLPRYQGKAGPLPFLISSPAHPQPLATGATHSLSWRPFLGGNSQTGLLEELKYSV